MGLDSLFCAGGLIPDCARVVSNLIRQMHWSLGEFAFPLVDWCGLSKQGLPPGVDPCLPEEVEGTILVHTEGASAHVAQDPTPHTVIDGRFSTDYTFHVHLVSVVAPMVRSGVLVRMPAFTQGNTFTLKDSREFYGSQGTTSCSGSAEGRLVPDSDRIVGQTEAGSMLGLDSLWTSFQSPPSQMEVACTGPDGGTRLYEIAGPTSDVDTCLGASAFHRGGSPVGQIQRQGTSMQIKFDCTLSKPDDPWEHSYVEGVLTKTD